MTFAIISHFFQSGELIPPEIQDKKIVIDVLLFSDLLLIIILKNYYLIITESQSQLLLRPSKG